MRTAPAVLVLALSQLFGSGCGAREPLEQRLERNLLSRQKEALQRELARGQDALDSDVVVIVPSSLIDELLAVALPIETVIDGRFRVTADSARVDFERGLALVHVHGRVAAADRPSVSAQIELAGILQVLDVGSSGMLASRVEILGWQTQELRLGTLSPPAGRLLDELAGRPAGELNELLSRIEIPVRLAPTIPLPAVSEDEVTIPAAEIPLEARVQEVRVGGGRLWVHVGVAVAAGG